MFYTDIPIIFFVNITGFELINFVSSGPLQAFNS